MTSIFSLKTTPSQLASSNNGTSRLQYNQVTPTRDVTFGNFPNGQIIFKSEFSGQQWWIPSRSYLRFRCRLTKANGQPLTLSDNIAPNMDLCAALFQSCEFRIAEKTVSRCSDYVAQVDALQKRIDNSNAQLQNMYSSLNWWQPYFSQRQNEVCIDAAAGQFVTAPSVALDRLQLGLDAAGGATAADRNAIEYNNTTGVATLSQNGGAAIAAINLSVAFPPGSYLRYSAIQGRPATSLDLNKPIRVTGGISNTQIQCVPGALSADVANDGRTNFDRVTQDTALLEPPAQKLTDFELCWQPPLSIFGVDHALPSGKYELTLTPQTASVFRRCAIESLAGNKDPGVNFNFDIVDMYWYVCQVDGPRVDDKTYLLDLCQHRLQTEDLTSASFGQKNFDVSPSTYALTVAFQDLRTLSSSQFSQTRFVSFDTAGNTQVDLNLNRLQVNYDTQSMPNPDADPRYRAQAGVNGGIDWTTQRYYETQLYTGAAQDPGSAENIQVFHERGTYYYFSWPRDGLSRATRVNVYAGFESGTDVSQTRMLLFDSSRQVAKVQIVDGRVIDVVVEDA